ncbi:MAG: hypothetical protein II937_00535 [Bacteroidales bacterium]|nr:hypothetical protein [Bacteroidales bacterium]
MKANKYLFIALFAATALCYTACKDDDSTPENSTTPTEINIDGNVANQGIDIAATTTSYTLPISASGKWMALLDDECDWAAIDDCTLIYEGSKKVVIVCDPNNSSAPRSTILTIYKEDGSNEEIDILITQRGSDSNGNFSGDEFSKKGLGHGAEYEYVLNTKGLAKLAIKEDEMITKGSMKEEDRTRFDPTKVFKNNSVFNISRIQQLQNESKLSKSAYVESSIQIADMNTLLLDSCLQQEKELSVNMKVDVSFGFLELSAQADYKSHKTEDRKHVDYFIARSAPMYHAYLSEDELSNFADSVGTFELTNSENIKLLEAKKHEFKVANARDGKDSLPFTAKQQKQIDKMKKKINKPSYGGIFSVGFSNKYYELTEAILDEDHTTANKVLEQLDNAYGPFIIGGANLGGTICMHGTLNTMYLDGDVEVGATLETEMGGLLNISGELSYNEKGASIFRNSDLDVSVFGGDANKVADATLNLLTSEKPDDLETLRDIIRDWVKSMESTDGNKSQAMPISFTMTPIWTLFADMEVQSYARAYFILRYKSRGILNYLGFTEVGDMKSPSVEDILNLAGFDEEK